MANYVCMYVDKIRKLTMIRLTENEVIVWLGSFLFGRSLEGTSLQCFWISFATRINNKNKFSNLEVAYSFKSVTILWPTDGSRIVFGTEPRVARMRYSEDFSRLFIENLCPIQLG